MYKKKKRKRYVTQNKKKTRRCQKQKQKNRKKKTTLLSVHYHARRKTFKMTTFLRICILRQQYTSPAIQGLAHSSIQKKNETLTKPRETRRARKKQKENKRTNGTHSQHTYTTDSPRAGLTMFGGVRCSVGGHPPTSLVHFLLPFFSARPVNLGGSDRGRLGRGGSCY